MSASKKDEGWGWPGLAKKAHYFDGTMALCRRWLFYGPKTKNQKLVEKPGPDDCVTCWRAAKKRAK